MFNHVVLKNTPNAEIPKKESASAISVITEGGEEITTGIPALAYPVVWSPPF
ncbi:MAG: hypothetical protein BWY27_00150 [Bacteroidetes bacterium ADurb.Bin234]|nr:MAG: hypothetical protein BWY27_00150 [Bacteroidetes bacterium ADurb.Bin234]